MAEIQKVELKKVAWNCRAAFLLGRSIHDDLVGLATLENMLVEGRADLYELHHDGIAVAAYAIAFNRCENGLEAVVVAAGADWPGMSLTKAMFSAISQTHGAADRIRVNASRPGMERRLERLGFKKQAVIYTRNF